MVLNIIDTNGIGFFKNGPLSSDNYPFGKRAVSGFPHRLKVNE